MSSARQRIAEVFDTANAANCGYVVTTVAFEPTTRVAAPAEHRWHTLVIPPVEHWMGLDATMPLVRWIGRLVDSADQVVAIGTGTFLLAAAGRLVDVDVVVDHAHAPMLPILPCTSAGADGIDRRPAFPDTPGLAKEPSVPDTRQWALDRPGACVGTLLATSRVITASAGS